MSNGGYTNHETYLVIQHIDNGSWSACDDMAKEILNKLDLDQFATEMAEDHYDQDNELAPKLKEHFYDTMLERDGSLKDDFIQAALREVNWLEIASSVIENALNDLLQ